MIAFGLLEVAAELAAVELAGAAVALAATALGLPAALAAAAGLDTTLGAVVGAEPDVGGDVGATAVDALQAAINAEAIGNTRPTWRRSARRAICTPLSYSPAMRPVVVGVFGVLGALVGVVGGLVGVLVALVAVLALWHPARVAVQALLLLPALFPSASIDPLAAITPAPVEDQQTVEYAAGTLDIQFFAPAGGDFFARADGRFFATASGGRHPAVMLLLGAGDLPRSDLAIHFAQALARLGVVAALPESSGMLAEHLSFDEVDAIRVSLRALDARSDVDATRVGIVGLSASGGLSIVAAAQPDLRDQIRFVNSFGSYDDASTLVVDVASRSVVVDGSQKDWTPEPRTVEVVSNALLDAGVTDSDRSELLGGTTRDRATHIVESFPPSVRERLTSVSPSAVLDQIHAHLYLMHDVDDPFIPFTESRALVASAPRGLVTRYTEFAIFEHVIPDRPVPWQTFLPDFWRLFWHLHAVLLELV